MPWYAQPRGGWTLYDAEGEENALMMNGFMNEYDFSLESQSAVIACCGHEGAYNPWRWGLDQTAMSSTLQGYGLFQYTPWSKYVGDAYAETLEGYAPNLSVDEVTAGADPADGWAQMLYFDTTLQIPGNWAGYMWRVYWNTDPDNPYALTEEEYEYYRSVQADVVSRWGDGDGWVSYETFKQMDIIDDAVWAFLAGFEGPAWPKYWESACDLANGRVWEIISGDTPPDRPSYGKRKKMPLWMYLRRY